MRRLSTISGMQVKSLMTLLLTMIAMTLLALLLTLFPTPIQAATPFTTNGNFSVGSDGSANYSIPIQVPPGTSGMTPTLSLNYNSNGGNGILGMGWGLDGLSQISRCPKTIIQDGAVGGVNYDVNDKLCLDGQRLISTGGTYGGNATEYRTEQANFAKIISYTSTTANGPDYFKVWTKAGQIIEYGNSPDSRIEAAGKAVVRTWGVNKISDTKGNYLTVSYTEDNANGEAYIQRIDYTGNASSTPVVTPYASVQFSYETRPDISTGYHAGSVIKSTKRISNIKTYAPASTTNNTPTLVKDYRLTYEQGTATQRSRLKTLTECDGQTTPTCQQPVEMGWQDFSTTQTFNLWTSSIGLGSVNAYEHHFIDVNGDGLTDLVQVSRTTNSATIGLNTGNGNFQLWTSSAGLGSVNAYEHNFVDVSGDGLPDLVLISRATNSATIGLNTGNGNFQLWTSSAGLGSVNAYEHHFIDVNGDGLTDLVQVSRTTNSATIGLNTGNGNFQLWTSSAGLGSVNAYEHNFVDVSGDGLPDLVLISRAANSATIGLNTGNGNFQLWTSSAGLGSVNAYEHHFIDVNGDGLTDLVQVSRTTNSATIGLNTGNGNFQLWTSSAGLGSVNAYEHNFVDVSGDGLPDLVLISRATNSATIGLNTGNGNFQLWTSSAGLGSVNAYEHHFIDVNGDGLIDLVQVSRTTNSATIGLNIGISSDLLTTLAPGLSSTISLTYKPITDSSVYVKDTAATVGTTTCPLPVGNTGTAGTYPIVEVQEPMYVVSTATDSDGNGGVLTNNYNYGGLKAHVTGRGSLGFRYQKVTQVDPDINSTTFFRQGYPYIGLPCQTEKRITSSNTLIGASALTYANSPITTGNAISQFPYLSQAVEQSFELTGTLINSTTTTNQYDTYGNATQISVNSGDGYVKTTTNVYNNDAGNWLLGRLLRSTVTSTTP